MPSQMGSIRSSQTLLPIPLPPNSPTAEYAPDLVIISAGFDAAEGDPIGGCHLTPECYAHMAAQLQLVAPTVALLEGGYNLLSTAAGTEAVLRVLLGERPPPLPPGEQSACEGGLAAVARAMRVQARHWACMRGLVQQQFRVMADAAARKQSVAAAAAAAAAAAGEDRHDLHSGPYLLDEGEEWDDDGCGPHLPGRRPWAAAEGMEEEAEADTPSQRESPAPLRCSVALLVPLFTAVRSLPHICSCPSSRSIVMVPALPLPAPMPSPPLLLLQSIPPTAAGSRMLTWRPTSSS